MAYRIVSLPITLSDLQCHSPIARLPNAIFRTVVQ